MVAVIAGCGRLGFDGRSLDAAVSDADSAVDVIDAADIDAIPTDLVSALVAYWRFNEAAGGTCASGGDSCDATANAFDGTWSGNATPAPGKFGRGILLDGSSNAWIDLGTTKVIDGTVPFTIAAWVRLEASPGVNDQAAIFSRRTSNNPGYLQFSIGSYAPDDRLIVFDTNGPGGAKGYLATVEVPLGMWHHVAVTSDLVDLTFYLDGVASGTQQYFPPTAVGGLPQRLGAFADSNVHRFPGMLDEVRIYERRLTGVEVGLLAALIP